MPEPEPPASSDSQERNPDEWVQRAETSLRGAKHMAWTYWALRRAGIFVNFLIVLLGLYVGVMYMKDLLMGRSHTYHFTNIPSPQRTRAEFETEFAKRLSDRGYKVGKVRVTQGRSDREFDGEVILIHVPSKTSDSTLWLSVHEVMTSLEDKHLPVEK